MNAVVAFLVVTFAVVQAHDFASEWNNYKAQFNKNYASLEEDEFRFKIFVENKQKIEEHNVKYEKGEVSYKMGLNQFSDWTAEEFKKILGTRPRTNNDVVKAFNDWKAKFNKSYTSVEEEEFRFKIFAENKKKIEEHNAKYEKGEVSYKMGLNQFSDWTAEEFKKILGTRPRTNNDVVKAFNDWKAKFNKSYISVEEEEFRFKIFAENKKKIEEHNAKYEKGEVSYKMGLNQFSDWTDEEFKKILGTRPRANNDVVKAFNVWKANFNKNYASIEDEEFRLKIFTENKQKVEEHNAKYERGQVSYKLGLNQFSDWIKFNKNYANLAEEKFRYKIFAESKKEVDEHNAKYEKGEVSWRKGLNQFSDWTQEEFKKILGSRPNSNIQKAWKEYKAKYNKNYASVQEDEFRFKIFAENNQKVDEHNTKYEKGEVMWEMGLNQFSDFTPEELREHLGF